MARKKFTADEVSRAWTKLVGQRGMRIYYQDFEEGMNHELEHQDVTHGDPLMTAKIAMAHLREDPAYYTKLKRMEAGRCG